MNSQLSHGLCVSVQFASEVIGGTTWFLGTTRSLQSLSQIAVDLDVDGSAMQTVRQVLNATAVLVERKAAFDLQLSHFQATLQLAGNQFRAYDHRCVFCSLALGPNGTAAGAYGPGLGSQVPPGYPSQVLLFEERLKNS